MSLNCKKNDNETKKRPALAHIFTNKIDFFNFYISLFFKELGRIESRK